VADPFRPTGELVAMLLERARQMRTSPRRTDMPGVWPRTGYERAALN
jgi:hypothetical protein